MAIPRQHIAVTPHDTNANRYDALWIETGGDVVVADADGTEVTYTKPDDSYILVKTTLVKSTGTTATGIIGLIF